jgi:hypothetical protein
MPIGEIIGEALGGVLKIAVRFVFEVIFELLVKGTGYLLIRLVRPQSDPGESACGIVGVLFWAAVGVGIYVLFRALAT